MNAKQIVEALKNAEQVQIELVDLASNLAVFGVCNKCYRSWYEPYDPILGNCFNGFHADAKKAMALWEQVSAPLREGADAP